MMMNGREGRTYRILLIDDDEAQLISTRGLLEDEGYEVHTQLGPLGSTNAVRALKPDLVLLDVNMPGLAGHKLSRLLKGYAEGRATRLILYSSNDEDILRLMVREQELDGYICKGSPSQLRNRVRILLDRASGVHLR